jgi:transposase-like protein
VFKLRAVAKNGGQMTKQRKRYSSEFKLRAVLAVLKEDKTAAQLAGELEVHPMALSEWKKHFLTCAHEVFEKGKKSGKSPEEEKAELFEEIGRLKMELEWLKKKSITRFS